MGVLKSGGSEGGSLMLGMNDSRGSCHFIYKYI